MSGQKVVTLITVRAGAKCKTDKAERRITRLLDRLLLRKETR